jgi:hypothetical protein
LTISVAENLYDDGDEEEGEAGEDEEEEDEDAGEDEASGADDVDDELGF